VDGGSNSVGHGSGGSRELEDPGEDYRGWPLRQRLELLAFDAKLAVVPQALLEALWQAIDALPALGCRARTIARPAKAAE
jgi:hypothetical protein